MKIRDFMTRDVITVRKEMTVKELIHFLDDHAISGVPVTDEHGKVIGAISVTDIMRRSDYVNHEIAHIEESYEIDPCSGMVEVHRYFTSELFESRIETLMSSKLISLSPENTLQDAIEVFLASPVHRILILDNERLVGLITTKDTLRAMTATAHSEGG